MHSFDSNADVKKADLDKAAAANESWLSVPTSADNLANPNSEEIKLLAGGLKKSKKQGLNLRCARTHGAGDRSPWRCGWSTYAWQAQVQERVYLIRVRASSSTR